MGSVFNRGSPERPNIWIKYRDVDGRLRRLPVGHVNPTGKTLREIELEERELRRLGTLSLSKVELNVAAGLKGLVLKEDRAPSPLFGPEGLVTDVNYFVRPTTTILAGRHQVTG